MMKVAVIGVGSISDCHLDSYVKNPETELYAICDINEKTLKAQGDRYNIPEERRFLDYKELLKLDEIEAVSVCTWNSEHAPVTIAALKAGKHVMCEKPMATNVADAKAMLEAAKESGKHLQIGFVRRFGNDTEVLKDLPGMVDFLPELPEYGPDLYFHKKMKTDASVAAKTLPLAIAKLESLSAWTEEALHEALLGAAAENGLKNGQLLWPVRVALSGKPSTPGGAIEIAFLLGRDESLRRLQKGLDMVKDL